MKIRFTFVGILVFLLFVFARFVVPAPVKSANLLNTKDTLQSSRLSVAARVKSPTAGGSSIVYIYTTGAAGFYTISTSNLRAGDVLTIGTGTYTVLDIMASNEFSVSPVLAGGDAVDTTAIYLKMKPQHVITFNTSSAVANGFFRVLLPSSSIGSSASWNDGNPDSGWDFGGGSVTVGATANASGYTFVTGVATASGQTNCTAPANYHCFEVHYSGTGNTNATITISIGQTNAVNTPVAPAPASGHTEATADAYTFQVQHYDSTNTVIDQTNGKVAMIESVRVTVTVDPSITFTIAGVGVGTSACGLPMSVDTSAGTNAPLAVPFGTMQLNIFKQAAHLLTVSTNAASGYVVTAIENQPLGKGGASSPSIPDTTCDSGTCSRTLGVGWTGPTNNGFGYAIHNVSATGVDPTNSYTGYATGFREFASLASAQAPVQIFYGSTVANSQQAYVCYKISVGATQAAGSYENQVTYTATASF